MASNTENHETTDQAVENSSYGFERRKLLKGAAWSVPVIAMAVASPAAAASTVDWNVAVSRSCGLSIAGQSGLAGFTITNNGTAPAPGPITLTLTDGYDTTTPHLIDAAGRAAAWASLQLFSLNLFSYASSGVEQGSWSDVQYERLNQVPFLGYRWKAYRTRTITIPAGLAPGQSVNIGQLLNVNVFPGGAYKNLTLTSDTGSASGDEVAVIDPGVVAGC